MSNLVIYPDLNHNSWSRSFTYLNKRSPTTSPESSTDGVITFRMKRSVGFAFCYSEIAPTEFNKEYHYKIWMKSTSPNTRIRAYRVNYTDKSQRVRYTFGSIQTVPADGQWHQFTWTFNNTSQIRGKSLSFIIYGNTGVNYSLWKPEINLVVQLNEESTSTTNNESTSTTNNESSSTSNNESTSTSNNNSSTNNDFSKVYAENINAVVNIMMESQTKEIYSGTGFFISASGLIATAAHVVVHGGSAPEPYGRKIWVHYYPENKTVEATVVGVDRLYDVALIKVNLTNRTYMNFLDSRDVKIGSAAVAMGQPLGNHVQSITGGIVIENKGQDYSWMAESLMVDFEIIGGNSGGPVLDLNGKCIGIVSWGLSDGAYALNGAIASHAAMKAIDYIRTNNKDYPASYIGVSFSPVDMYDTISRNIERVEGVLVINVQASSPAYNAGIRNGDIITHCNNKVVGKNNNQEPFGTLVHFAPRGTNLTLKVLKAPNYNTVSTITLKTTALPGQYDYIFSNKYSIQHLKEGKRIIFT